MKNSLFLELSVMILVAAAVGSSTRKSLAQADPRRFHHSVNIVPFVEAGAQKYYLFWASSKGKAWEQDIFVKTLQFNAIGQCVVNRSVRRLIGTGNDGAQEPVSVALNPRLGLFLCAREDGTDLSEVVDVRAQLNRLHGTVIKRNFLVAGGPEAQHSAAAVHCGNCFLVEYADEAPPAHYATVMAKILDDSTGKLLQALHLTSDWDDNWWPVLASSDGHRHIIVGWGNGDSFFTGLITCPKDSFVIGSVCRALSTVNQYFCHVRWVEALHQFLIVGCYGGVTQFAWVDTLGVVSGYSRVPVPITRETRFAVSSLPGKRACMVAYTTSCNDG